MNSRLLAVLCFYVLPAVSSADEQTAKDAEIKRLQDEVAILTAKNDIATARYGEAIKGKSGEVTNPDKLSGMAYQHLPWATQQVGAALGNALNTSRCSDGTVLLSGSGINDKVALAISFSQQLAQLDSDITKATPTKGVRVAVPALLSAAGGAVALTGLFKTDYAVSASEMNVDMDWLVASIVLNRPYVTSDRFPDRTLVDTYIKRVDDLKQRASNLPKSEKKDDIKKRLDSLITQLYKPNEDGTLPIVLTALLSPIAADKLKCIALITGARAAPLLLTKDTIWGKGGRAFVYLPVQASIIQLSANGSPLVMACQVATVSAPIKLSDLTSAKHAAIPWSGGAAQYAGAAQCSEKGPAAVK